MLYDALSDPLLSNALSKFFEKQKQEHMDSLLTAVRQYARDTMKEARLAGKAESYEEALGELQRFSEEQLRGATNG